MATPQATQNGAASFNSIEDKLAAIIFLLNTQNMTAQAIQTGAAPFQPIQDKLAAIIYLLANASGSGVLSGSGAPSAQTPVPTASAGALYFDTAGRNLWAADGTAWFLLV